MNRAPALPKPSFFGSAATTITLALGIALPSCGGDDPAPAGPGPIPLEAFAEEYTAAACTLAVRCGAMPDQDTCLSLDRASYELLQLMTTAVFGDVTYSPDAARSCINALRAQSCDVLLSAQRNLETTCKGVFQGAAQEGDSCLVAGECAGDSICNRGACEGTGDPCCLGQCAPAVKPVPMGGVCGENRCEDPAYCDLSNADPEAEIPEGVCRERQDNGQACTASNACKDGQRCDLSTNPGKCYILSKEGGQCNATLDVACLAVDNWCDPAEGKCVKLPGPGQPCTPNNRCLGHAYCNEGTCRMRPVESEACGGDGPQCLGALRCEGEICTAPPTSRVCVPDINDG
ncbi:EB domain-containing protein [Chondromyces crocatus]|uniref:Dickkopf N-terminal cysteine-rich domain-containing protein n=1 Tax=Chondromyces crocatus TaxID=52 RepID=A0A0K1EMF2_CHOCO|nr:hypothetical protein [Chondromyces crocatus]AKT42001.1 uncharacterized protein CMC5_062230 [Chondromyces crocatus]